jgi:hypothetical protein
MIKVKAKCGFYFFGRNVKAGESVQIDRDVYDDWVKDGLCFPLKDIAKAQIEDAEIDDTDDEKPKSKSKSKSKTKKVK